MKRGFYEKAVTQFTKLVEKCLNYPEAYYFRGLSYYEKGDFDNAISDTSKAIEMKPDYAEAYFDRARYLTGVSITRRLAITVSHLSFILTMQSLIMAAEPLMQEKAILTVQLPISTKRSN